MRVVTFVSKYDGLMIIQKEGREPRSRLWAEAAGLQVYLLGTAKGTARDTLTNLGCNLALSMNIPLVSFHYAKNGKK